MTGLWIAVAIAVLVVAWVVLARKGAKAREGCVGWQAYSAASQLRFNRVVATGNAGDEVGLKALPEMARQALKDQAAQQTPEVLLPLQRELIRFYGAVIAAMTGEFQREGATLDAVVTFLGHQAEQVQREWKWVDFCAGTKPP